MNAERLARILQGARVSDIRTLLNLLADQKFDGNITLHFRGGLPRKVELGRPVEIEILSAGIPGPLDKPKQEAAHSATMR